MAPATPTLTLRDYQVKHAVDWCPGCGDFGILTSLQQALAKLGLPPHRVAIFGGIGCSGKTPYYMNTYGANTLHGRVLPVATGAKLANPELTVIAVGGDGDGLAIGAGHFVNAGRRNLDLTYILFNNEVYGLTKGQASPTLPLGLQTKSLPEPTIQGRVNPLMMAFSAGYTWIGRSYAYDIRHQVELIQKAIQHPGLSFLEVMQPCPTYNDIHTKEFFAGKDLEEDAGPRVYHLDPEEYDPIVPEDADPSTLLAISQRFLEKAHEWGERIPVGVFLENRSVSTFEKRIATRLPGYPEKAPALQAIADAENRSLVDLSPLFQKMAV